MACTSGHKETESTRPCHGIDRLVLRSTIHLLAPGRCKSTAVPHAHRDTKAKKAKRSKSTRRKYVPNDEVFRHCRRLADDRGEPIIARERFDQTLVRLLERELIKRWRKRIQATKCGIIVARRSCDLPQAHDEKCRTDAATANAWWLLQLLCDLQSNRDYEYDPRVNRYGQIEEEDLADWFVDSGRAGDEFEHALMLLVRNGYVRLIPVAPQDFLRLVCPSDHGAEVVRTELEPDLMSIFRWTDLPLDSVPQSHVCDVVLKYLAEAETPLRERIDLIPDWETKAIAAGMIDVGMSRDAAVWPRFGVPHRQILEFAGCALPGVSTGVIAPEWTHSGTRLKQTGFFRYVREYLPDVSDAALNDACLPDNFPANGLCVAALDSLLEARRVRIFDCLAPGANINGARGIVFRLPATEHADSSRTTVRNAVARSRASDSLAREIPQDADTPQWDEDRRELRFARQVVRTYERHPAPNQTAILAAFEKAGWPRSIPNPLSDKPRNSPDPRLNHTVRDLNKSIEPRLIRFRQDGTGSGVLWEAVLPNE